MKKLLTGITMVFIALVILTPLANAQKVSFKGTILYDVKAEGDIPEQAKSMMPTEMTCKLTADKQSMSMTFGMMEQKTIYDAVKQDVNMLMNVMGQKFNIKSTAAQISDLKKNEGASTSVKFTNETKTIAGYSCKKAIATIKTKDGSETEVNVFYTDAIDVSSYKFSNSFPEINGLPLEYTMKLGPMSFNLVARSIKKENIPASEFVIPTDYKQVTTEELKNMFGGASGQ
jgi:GLPGLI family protein